MAITPLDKYQCRAQTTKQYHASYIYYGDYLELKIRMKQVLADLHDALP